MNPSALTYEIEIRSPSGLTRARVAPSRGGMVTTFEAAGRDKIKAQPGQELDPLTPAQLAEWRKAAEPLQENWAAKVRKIGLDPDTVLKELKADLAQYKAAY